MSERFIAQVRTPELYFRQFVPRSEKQIATPAVVFAHLSSYGGYYRHPVAAETWVGNRALDCSRGLIVVDPSEEQEEVLAHEWRHHWQCINGWKYDGIGWDGGHAGAYEHRIREYFTRSRSEMDALLFSRRVGSPTLEYWLDLLEVA